MPNNARITINRFRKALNNSLGIITTVGSRLGVDRNAVYYFLKKNPKLWEEVEQEREKILDRAESVLFKKVIDEDMRAVEFALKNLGGMRGYAERRVVEADVNHSLTAESFRDAWKAAKEDKDE